MQKMRKGEGEMNESKKLIYADIAYLLLSWYCHFYRVDSADLEYAFANASACFSVWEAIWLTGRECVYYYAPCCLASLRCIPAFSIVTIAF